MLKYLLFLTGVGGGLEKAKTPFRNIRMVPKQCFDNIFFLFLSALGNYMNSTKKGPCYGFRLQSLDSLSITKSSDKKQTLVHYLANLVNSKYPELKGFESELKYIDKAAQFSLENILTDVRELEKGKKFVMFCQKLAQSV